MVDHGDRGSTASPDFFQNSREPEMPECPRANRCVTPHPLQPLQSRQPFHQETPLGFLLRQFERAFVSGAGFAGAVEAAEHVRPGGVGQVIPCEVAAADDLVDQFQSGIRNDTAAEIFAKAGIKVVQDR